MGNREIARLLVLSAFVALCAVVLFSTDTEAAGKIMRFHFNLGISGSRPYADNRLSQTAGNNSNNFQLCVYCHHQTNVRPLFILIFMITIFF